MKKKTCHKSVSLLYLKAMIFPASKLQQCETSLAERARITKQDIIKSHSLRSSILSESSTSSHSCTLPNPSSSPACCTSDSDLQSESELKRDRCYFWFRHIVGPFSVKRTLANASCPHKNIHGTNTNQFGFTGRIRHKKHKARQ